MARVLLRTTVLLLPLLGLASCQNASSDVDNGCEIVDIPIRGISFVQTSFNLSLDFRSGTAIGILSDGCPLNGTLADGADLTCIEAVLNGAMTSSPQSLVICLSLVPAELTLSLAASDPSMPTVTPTGLAANTDCDDIDDLVKYAVLGGFGASGLLNIILVLLLICQCCKRHGKDDVATANSRTKDRQAVDLIVPNKAPVAWGGKSDTMVQTSSEDWCVTPNATINHSIIRHDSGTFEYVESHKLKERMPMREDLYVHRPKPNELEYSDYTDAKPQQATFEVEPHDVTSAEPHNIPSDEDGDHARRPTAVNSSTGRSLDESTSSRSNDQEPATHDSVDSLDLFPRPAAKLPPEHAYRELEPPSMAANGISVEHTYVTHPSDQPINLEDMTPRKESAGKRLLSGDYTEVTTRGGDGELRSYL